MKLKVKNKIKIAEKIYQFDLDIAGKNFNFKPGQFASLDLLDKNGQVLKERKRFFSFISSPNDKETLSIATQIGLSGFKHRLKYLEIGYEVELGVISGRFTLPEVSPDPLAFIAGGIGITPFISMLRYLKESKDTRPIKLLYSVREKENAVYLEELKQLTKDKLNFELILTVTNDPNWLGEKRRIEKKFLTDHLGDLNQYLYYIVGPTLMVQSIKVILLELGVQLEKIHLDYFSGY